MRYGLNLQSAPGSEPLTTAEAKKQCEVATAITAHDTLLDNLITAARQAAERQTGRALITQTWDLYLDRFPVVDELLLPNPSLSSVTSITYTDDAGASQTWAASNYIVSTGREPGRITRAYGVSWPTTRAIADAVRIRYVAGYGAASAVPKLLKAGMLLLVAHWFRNREAVVTGTIATEIPLTVQRIFEQFAVGDEFHQYAQRND